MFISALLVLVEGRVRIEVHTMLERLRPVYHFEASRHADQKVLAALGLRASSSLRAAVGISREWKPVC